MLVAAAVVMAVLLAGVWLIVRPTTHTTPQVSGVPTSPSAVASAPEPQNTGLAASPPPATQDAVPPGQRQRGQPPPGWTLYTDPTGFSLFVPVGSRMSRENGIMYFRGNGRTLGVDQTDKPQPDPVSDWQRQRDKRRQSGDFPGYSEVSIHLVPYWRIAADWEFSYNESGGRVHAVNRGFVVSDHKAYGIWWSTVESQWAASTADLQIIFDSFRPAPDAVAP
jgi:hypothetical protein